MRLHSLHLQNFRQHADTVITFDLGLTGIIGTNGCGKSTVLEGIGFVLYGVPSTRGKKDSIKWNRAQPRGVVRGALEFTLANHRYRVVRTLTSAEIYQDGAETPMANSLSGVSEQLTRILGMTRDEFFNTYFTGQKELNLMATLGPTERGKFLARVLGYDRLGDAQELIRERKRALVAEAAGVRASIPDLESIVRELADANARLEAASTRLLLLRDDAEHATAALALTEPRWVAMQQTRDRDQELANAMVLATQQEQAARRDCERLQADVARIETAEVERTSIVHLLEALPALRVDLERWDRLSRQNVERQQFMGQLQLQQDRAADMRAELIADATVVSAVDASRVVLANAEQAVSAAETLANAARDAWKTDVAEHTAALTGFRTQLTALKEQKASLQSKGADGVCVTCQQALGDTWQANLVRVTDDITKVMDVGTRTKEQLALLECEPANVTDAATTLTNARAQVTAAAQHLTSVTQVADKNARLQRELQQIETQIASIQQSLSAVGETYDATQHTARRSEFDRLKVIETRVAVLDSQLVQAASTRAALGSAESLLQSTTNRVRDLLEARNALLFSQSAFEETRAVFTTESETAKRAMEALTATEYEVTRAEESKGFALRRQADCATLREKLAMLDVDRLRHEALDQAYSDYRTELNANLRPELAEIASGLLEVLTDGRYTQAEFDDNYVLTVMEDGIAKPVISGGEEDLCNLVLRLAISQMIAQRAGHAFSLLILDEVFGSLDQTRRNNVVQLLRSLNDQFEQVIVITHFDEMRDTLDNLIRVQYDAELGCSTVVNGDFAAIAQGAGAALAVAA